MEENEKNSNKNQNKPKKKFGLTIDYSKFQNKFINNSHDSNYKKKINFYNNENNEENIQEKINNNNNEKIINDISNKHKNLEHFLNVSEILNENDSQSLLLENTNQNNQKESNLKINNNEDNINKIDKKLINNNLDDILIGGNDEINLLTVNYNDLIINKDKNYGKIKIDRNFKSPVNSSKKKNYIKFLNHNKVDLDRKKNSNNNKRNIFSKFITQKNNKNIKKNKNNSYVQLIKKNNLFEPKNGNKYPDKQKKNESFNLLNEFNYKHNSSITNLSDISNIAPTSTTNTDISYTNSKISYKTINKKKKTENILFSEFNKKYNNNFKKMIVKKKKISNNKNNISYDNNKYFNISDLNLMSNKIHDKKKLNKNNINEEKINKSNLLIYSHGKKRRSKDSIYNKYLSLGNKPIKAYKNNTERGSKNDLTHLLDNIKDKFKNKENTYLNQQKNMKNEIDILREKLKKLTVNEALYQVEIEKLKRKNDNKNGNNINKEQYNNKIELKLNKDELNLNDINSNEKYLGQKLENIIQNQINNNKNNNMNQSTFSNNKNVNQLEQLLKVFNLDKSIFNGENLNEEYEDVNYIDILNKYPNLRKFIDVLANKYKNEKKYRIRLEEKTVEIFTNDMKTINILEKKIKKYEGNRHFRISSSLNVSSDGGFSDNNITKNSYQSCDKIL